MDFALSDDQRLFVETIRKHLERECPITQVRELHETADGFDRAFWQQTGELGWTSMLVPEADGGGSVSGNGLLDAVLVAEEVGRAVGPGPFTSTNVVASALADHGSEEQRRNLLPNIVAGRTIATWALSESGRAWDSTGVALRAERNVDGWQLDGTKTLVESATSADLFLVVARAGDRLLQFLVPASAPGVSVEALESLDLVRRFGEVTFDEVRVDTSAVLGGDDAERDDATGSVERQLLVALAVQNAETVGALNKVFEFTLEYAMDRVAFGRPIGSYQALKHRFADMKSWIEACNATSDASARALQSGADNASELMSVAKSYIGGKAGAIVQDCIQIHGGIGVTWEHNLHLYLRRVTQNALLYGNVGDHRARIAATLAS